MSYFTAIAHRASRTSLHHIFPFFLFDAVPPFVPSTSHNSPGHCQVRISPSSFLFQGAALVFVAQEGSGLFYFALDKTVPLISLSPPKFNNTPLFSHTRQLNGKYASF